MPIAVVGNEEAMPIVWKSPRLAKLLGLPYFPVTANNFVFGPVLGYIVPLPSKFRIRVLPPSTSTSRPTRTATTAASVLEYAEAIRRRSSTRSSTCSAPATASGGAEAGRCASS